MNRITGCAALCAVAASTASAEFITSDTQSTIIAQGGLASFFVTIEDNTTPLFGYSLDLVITPDASAEGSLAVDAGLTNFFDTRNLITAGGEARDPLFSVINATPNGAFVSTNTDDGSTVLAERDTNDVLVEVVFEASEDAVGDFQFSLGGGSALGDGDGFPVAFTSALPTITVIPTPSSGAPAIVGAGCLARRRR